MLDLPFYIGEHVIARLKPRVEASRSIATFAETQRTRSRGPTARLDTSTLPIWSANATSMGASMPKV